MFALTINTDIENPRGFSDLYLQIAPWDCERLLRYLERYYSSQYWQFDLVPATETRGSCTRFLLRSNKGANNDPTLLSSDYNTIYAVLFVSGVPTYLFSNYILCSCTLTPFHCIVIHFTSYYIGNFNTSKGFFFFTRNSSDEVRFVFAKTVKKFLSINYAIFRTFQYVSYLTRTNVMKCKM